MPGAARRLCLVALALCALGLLATRPAASGVPREPNVVVSLTFDDGRSDQLQALDPLAAHGMHATFYIVTGLLGDPEFMSWSDVRDLAARGHEIGGHTVTHQSLPTLTVAARQREVCGGRAALADRALGPIVSFAYPYGDYNADIEAVVRGCGYLSARRVGGVGPTGCNGCPLSEEIPPLDRWALRTPPVIEASTSLATMERAVTQAEARGGWVILVFHAICDHCSAYSTTLDDFTAFLDWLQPRAARGTAVETVGDVMNPPGNGAAAGLADASTGPPRALRGTSATIEGSVHPNGKPTTWHFEYGPTTSYGSSTPPATAGAGTAGVPVSAPLTGLTPGTTYHYCLVATTDAGSARGVDGIFRTRRRQPPPQSR